MGRPLYSEQTQISALPSKQAMNVDMAVEFGENTIAVGETKLFTFNAVESFIYEIDMMYVHFLGKFKKPSDLGAASGSININLQKNGINFAMATYTFGGDARFTIGQFNTPAALIVPDDKKMLFDIVYNKRFSQGNEFTIAIMNNTDVALTFTPYGEIQFIKEKTV